MEGDHGLDGVIVSVRLALKSSVKRLRGLEGEVEETKQHIKSLQSMLLHLERQKTREIEKRPIHRAIQRILGKQKTPLTSKTIHRKLVEEKYNFNSLSPHDQLNSIRVALSRNKSLFQRCAGGWTLNKNGGDFEE